MRRRATALAIFVREVYPPGLHLAYAAAWFLALDGTLARLAGAGRWRLGWPTVAGVATLFLVLFFLRVADEIKDVAYDRVHNPARPLVRGVVEMRDLAWFLGGPAVLVAALNALLSPWLAALTLGIMSYGVLLIWVERISPRVRDGMLLNLAVTYPVNVALSVYTACWFHVTRGTTPRLWLVVLAILAFALAFLHYELARKIAWPHLSRPTERLYSHVLGGAGAGFAACACAVGACGILLPLLQRSTDDLSPWLLAAPVIPAGLSLARFLGDRRRRRKLTPLATLFLLLFYGVLVVLASLPTRVEPGGTPRSVASARLHRGQSVLVRAECPPCRLRR